MDLSIAEETRLLEPGNEAENASLVAKPQVILKTDEVVAVGAQVFFAELHDGPRRFAGARVAKAHGLHGAEAERIASAAGEDFNRQATLEVFELLPFLAFCGLGANVCVDMFYQCAILDTNSRTGMLRATVRPSPLSAQHAVLKEAEAPLMWRYLLLVAVVVASPEFARSDTLHFAVDPANTGVVFRNGDIDFFSSDLNGPPSQVRAYRWTWSLTMTSWHDYS